MNFALCFTGLTEPLLGKPTCVSLGLCLLFMTVSYSDLLYFLFFLLSAQKACSFLYLCSIPYYSKKIHKHYLAGNRPGFLCIGRLSAFSRPSLVFHNNPYSLISSYGNENGPITLLICLQLQVLPQLYYWQ